MIKKAILGFSLLGATVALFLFFVFWLGTQEFKGEKQTYLDEGGILDPVVFAGPAIANAENAAVVYAAVFDSFRKLPDADQELLGDLDRIDDPAVPALLSKCRSTLETARAATLMPNCRWNLDYAAGVGTMEQFYLGRMRLIAKVLAMNVRFHALRAQESGQRNDDVLVRDIETIVRLGHHLAEDRTIIGQLCAVSTYGLAAGLYEDLFRDHPAPPNAVVNLLSQFNDRTVLRRGLEGELLHILATFEDMREQASVFQGGPSFSKVMFYWDIAHYVRMMRFAIADSDRPYFEGGAFPPDPWYARISPLFVDRDGTFAFTLAKYQTRMALLETAELLRAYKAEHGIYPAVDAGAVEMPIDPVTGKLIRYEVVGDGFVLTGLVGVPDEGVQWVWDQ